MDPHKLIILGAGGHAAVVSEAAALHGWDVIGFLDDAIDANLPNSSARHLGNLKNGNAQVQQMILDGVAVHAAAGSVEHRRSWYELFLGAKLATIIHPSASISASACIAEGAFVGPSAVVNARSKVGRGTIINSGSVVEHDVSIGEFAHLAPGSIATGEVRIEDDVMIGAGAVILPRVSVSYGSIVGAGSIVVNNVNEHTTVAGNPATVIS